MAPPGLDIGSQDKTGDSCSLGGPLPTRGRRWAGLGRPRHRKTGSLYLRSLGQHILSSVWRPVLSFLSHWIYDRELEDTYHEARNTLQTSDACLKSMDAQLLPPCPPSLLSSLNRNASTLHLNAMHILCSALKADHLIYRRSCIWLVENCYPMFNSGKPARSDHLSKFSNRKFTAGLGLVLPGLSPVFLAEQGYMFCCFAWLHETKLRC